MTFLLLALLAGVPRWTSSPGVAVPEMGVTEADARDLAAYLDSLR